MPWGRCNPIIRLRTAELTIPDTRSELIEYGRSPGTPIEKIENDAGGTQRVIRGYLKNLINLAKRHDVGTPASVATLKQKGILK